MKTYVQSNRLQRLQMSAGRSRSRLLLPVTGLATSWLGFVIVAYGLQTMLASPLNKFDNDDVDPQLIVSTAHRQQQQQQQKQQQNYDKRAMRTSADRPTSGSGHVTSGQRTRQNGGNNGGSGHHGGNGGRPAAGSAAATSSGSSSNYTISRPSQCRVEAVFRDCYLCGRLTEQASIYRDCCERQQEIVDFCDRLLA